MFCFKSFVFLLRLYPNRIDITQIRTIHDYFMGFRMQYNFEPNPNFYYLNPTCTNKILVSESPKTRSERQWVPERPGLNASASGQRGRNASNETRTRTTERFKWTYEQERKLIELFDEAISMSNYSLKDPKAHGRVYG